MSFLDFLNFFFVADQTRTSSQPDQTPAAPQQRKRRSDDSEAGPSSKLDPPAAKPKRTKPNQTADDLLMPDQELITDNDPRPRPNDSPMPDQERTTTNAHRPRPKDTQMPDRNNQWMMMKTSILTLTLELLRTSLRRTLKMSIKWQRDLDNGEFTNDASQKL